MKWFLNRGAKKASKEGIVGVYETTASISMVYVVLGEAQPVIKAQFFEAGEDQTRKQTVLTKFVNDNGLSGVPCSYVLGFGDYTLNLVDAPSVPKAEIPKAVSWVLRDLISFPVEDAVVDTFELPFLRAKDEMKMLYAAVVRKSVVSRIETFVNESGLILKFIDIPELTLKNIVSKNPEQINGCAFVKLVPTGGKLILCQDEKICISRSFNLNLDDLTTEQGPATLESLSLEIQRAFDYISSLFRKTIPNVLVIAPTSLDKMVIESSIKSALGMEIYYLKLSDYFQFENAIDDDDESDYVFALGATLRKEEEADATAN